MFKQPGVLRFNGKPVLVGDGIKVAKSGKKMPAVKKLHQSSESNTKPEYIFGHSCQAVALLMRAASAYSPEPLACRIHEGVVFSNRDKRTLLDKMILLVNSLDIVEPFYFVADAYYASGRIVSGLLGKGNHLVTKVRSNAVASGDPSRTRCECAEEREEGLKKYGEKVRPRIPAPMRKRPSRVLKAPSTQEKGVEIYYRTLDLLWRPVGIVVRFVIVRHPTRGSIFLMCTDLDLSPLDIIEIYGLRFKIEVSFKQALHVIGTFAYHFWMAAMTPIGRKS